MEKSPDAFRTISEVAELLGIPAHVLRFWESRFPQIRPVKRAGGRRYYRPTDVALLTGIKHLLHNEGLTIRGVQKMMREQGIRHVVALSGQELPDESSTAEAALEAALAANISLPAAPALPQEAAESAQIVALETALRARREQAAEPNDVGALGSIARAALPAADSAAPFAETTTFDGTPEASVNPATALADELPLFARAAPPAPRPLRLVDRLRQLPPGSLDTPAARALRDRLASLQVRVAAPPAASPL